MYNILCVGPDIYAKNVLHAANINGISKSKLNIWTTYYNNDTLKKYNLDSVDVAIFCGGEDISPSYYGHSNAGHSDTNSVRDAYEFPLAKKLIDIGVPLIGICRGAQFLCVIAGGKLVQDIKNHTRPHKIEVVSSTGDNSIVSPEQVTSTHHQMMAPNLPSKDYRIFAVTHDRLSESYFYNGHLIRADDAPEIIKLEPEVIQFHKIKGLAIQFHPEMMHSESWGYNYASAIISNHLYAYRRSKTVYYRTYDPSW